MVKRLLNVLTFPIYLILWAIGVVALIVTLYIIVSLVYVVDGGDIGKWTKEIVKAFINGRRYEIKRWFEG